MSRSSLHCCCLSAYSTPADVDAFELLKEDLKDDEENVIATINRLLTVALAIGPKRTRDELLPFLKGTNAIPRLHKMR